MYVVNGEEFSTKKDATKALFDALENGGEVTLSKAEEPVPADNPAPEQNGNGGPQIVL